MYVHIFNIFIHLLPIYDITYYTTYMYIYMYYTYYYAICIQYNMYDMYIIKYIYAKIKTIHSVPMQLFRSILISCSGYNVLYCCSIRYVIVINYQLNHNLKGINTHPLPYRVEFIFYDSSSGMTNAYCTHLLNYYIHIVTLCFPIKLAPVIRLYEIIHTFWLHGVRGAPSYFAIVDFHRVQYPAKIFAVNFWLFIYFK
jgi:hypothetical protein